MTVDASSIKLLTLQQWYFTQKITNGQSLQDISRLWQ